MKRSIQFKNDYFILSAALFLIAAISDISASPAMIEASAATLPNGLQVIVKSDHNLPVVAINIVIRAGSGNEPAGSEGAAHFLEHMLFRGSRSNAAGKVEAFIEAQGGAANAGTLRDFTHVYATVPVGVFKETLQALADAVLYPSLETAEIDQERTTILSEIARQNEDPRATLWDLSQRALFPKHPYAHPVNGSPETIFRLGREALVSFHKRWYVPNNIAVVVVGDINESEVLPVVKSIFGPLNPGPASQPVERNPDSLPAKREQVYYHDGSLSYIGIAVKAPGISSPREICAMDVLLAMLAEGNNPRLQTLLLENESLAFATGAEFLTSRQPSPFLIWAACRPEKAAEVKEKLDKEMTSIADGNIAAAEVSAAKRRLEMSFWSSDETYADQADVLGFYAAIDSYRFASEYIPLVRAVTVEEVRAAAKIYFASSARMWLSLLPKKPGDESSGGI